MTLTDVTLDVFKQNLLVPSTREKLKARLHELAIQKRGPDATVSEAAAEETELRAVQQDLAKAERNLGFADSAE